MIRVVHKKQPQGRGQSTNVSALRPHDRATLSLVGILIAEQPSAVASLLDRFGYPASGLSASELSTRTIDALSRNDNKFTDELSGMIADLLDTSSTDGYLGFDLGALLGQAGSAISDPISSISGAVGSVAGLIGQKGRARAEASALTTQSILNYRATQSAATPAKQGSKKIWFIGIILLLGLALFAAFSLTGNTPKTQAR